MKRNPSVNPAMPTGKQGLKSVMRDIIPNFPASNQPTAKAPKQPSPVPLPSKSKPRRASKKLL